MEGLDKKEKILEQKINEWKQDIDQLENNIKKQKKKMKEKEQEVKIHVHVFCGSVNWHFHYCVCSQSGNSSGVVLA